jgi:hypothetical protein
VLADRLLDARRELAVRLDPAPVKRRRRWPWLLMLLLAVGGAAAAVLLTRRPQETEPEPFLPPRSREPGSRDSDPNGTWGSPTANGAVSAERPSASTD